jgi:hypothetical protein
MTPDDAARDNPAAAASWLVDDQFQGHGSHTMRRWAWIGWIGLCLTVAACGTHAPGQVTGPSSQVTSPPTPSPAPTPPAPATRLIDGVLTDGDDGTPIAGAVLAGLFLSAARFTTDGNGYFVMSAPLYAGDNGTFVSITKPGYEDTLGWADARNDGRHDFRLFRPVTIVAGDTAHFTLNNDSSLCGSEGEYRCRSLHITAPTTGTLIIDTLASDGTGPSWLVIGETQYPFRGLTHLETAVGAGSTVTVHVYHTWPPAPSVSDVAIKTTLSN